MVMQKNIRNVEKLSGVPAYDFFGLKTPTPTRPPLYLVPPPLPETPPTRVSPLWLPISMLLGILLGPGDTHRSPVSDATPPEETPLDPVDVEKLRQEYLEEFSRLSRKLFNGEVDDWEAAFIYARMGILMMLLGQLPIRNVSVPPTIVNSASGTLDVATASSAPPTDPSTPDDWQKLIDQDPVVFLRAIRRWDVATHRAIAEKMDAGISAVEILEWLKQNILPTVTHLTTLIDRKQRWPSDRRGLVHDMKARLRGFSITEIYLEDGKLAHVRAMFNSEPGNLLEAVVTIQFGLETVLFSIDGLRGVHLSPAFSASLFNSILNNLIHNAVEHPGTDSLQITIRLRGRELKISDNGAGMTPDVLAAIRDGRPIHNGVPVDPDGPDRGHGEGWSKSIRESCERLGIQWVIDSEAGKGTTVTLTLPPGSLDIDAQFQMMSEPSESDIHDHLASFFGALTPAGQERLLTEWARAANTTPEQLLPSLGLPNLE